MNIAEVLEIASVITTRGRRESNASIFLVFKIGGNNPLAIRKRQKEIGWMRSWALVSYLTAGNRYPVKAMLSRRLTTRVGKRSPVWQRDETKRLPGNAGGQQNTNKASSSSLSLSLSEKLFWDCLSSIIFFFKGVTFFFSGFSKNFFR